MTLEEKLTHIQASSMELARAEANSIVDEYREALQKVFEDHKEEAVRQVETRVRAESLNARHQINQATAKSQLEIRRNEGRIARELKDKVFDEARLLIQDFMQTKEYEDFLVAQIRKAVRFANQESVVLYLNASDEKMRCPLQERTDTQLTVSTEDFIGGIRAVIRSRNILIDHSFQTLLRDEYDTSMFFGGGGFA